MNSKYTVKKAYSSTHTGRMFVVWNVMEGDFIVDTFSLKSEAVYYCNKYNRAAEIAARDSVQ